MNDIPIPAPSSSPQQPLEPLAAMSERELIKELYSALRTAQRDYASQNRAARGLRVSSSFLTRISPAVLATYSAGGRLPCPQVSTLRRLVNCEHERVRQIARVLLTRRD